MRVKDKELELYKFSGTAQIETRKKLLKRLRLLYTEQGTELNEEEKALVEKIRMFFAKPRDCVSFGKYFQKSKDSMQPIEWQVLDVKEEKALLISRYALDCKQYKIKYTDVTWETCTLRKWLNNEFMNSAFTAEEQNRILTVTVPADRNPGNATQDKIFLLSIPELRKYFPEAKSRKCKATRHAVDNGAEVNGEGCFFAVAAVLDTDDFFFSSA